MNQCPELNNKNCVQSYAFIGDPALNGSWLLSEYSRPSSSAFVATYESCSPCWAKFNAYPLDLKLLLLLMVPLVLADPAIAFDGGGFETEQKIVISNYQSKTELLLTIQNFTNPAWISR